MRRVRIALIATALLLTAPASAGAQQPVLPAGFLSAISPPAQLISTTTIPITLRGDLTVTFHGDPSSGCAAAGVCGYAGTVIWRPGSGLMAIVKTKAHGRSAYSAAFIVASPEAPGAATVGEVSRTAGGQIAGRCADGEGSTGGPAVTMVAGQAAFSLLASGGSTLMTRCAGPLDGDVAGAIPAVSVPLDAVLRGRTSVGLQGAGAFSGGGFAGTVSSTISLRLGTPVTTNLNARARGSGHRRRTRTVLEVLRVTRVSGAINETFAGTSNPTLCALLDSCGTSGTAVLRPTASGVVAAIGASGPVSRPYRDFLKALGLSRTGRSAGIDVSAIISWTSLGRLTTGTSSPQPCTDTAAAGDADAELLLTRGRLFAPAVEFGMKSRCPGPIGPARGSLLTASGPLARPGHRTFTITFAASSAFAEDGYTGRLNGRLSLTFRRGIVGTTIQGS